MLRTATPHTPETPYTAPPSALTRPLNSSILSELTKSVAMLVKEHGRFSAGHPSAFATEYLVNLLHDLTELAQTVLRGMNVAAVIRGLLSEEVPNKHIRSSLGVLLLYVEYTEYQQRDIGSFGSPWQTEAGQQLFRWWATGCQPHGVHATFAERELPVYVWAVSLAPQLCPAETVDVLTSHGLITAT